MPAHDRHGADHADAAAHRASTRREFARQAAAFERSGSLFRNAAVLDWICEHVPVSAGESVLDVAGGTGQLGRRLAAEGAFATIADLTPEMLREGLRASRAEGESGVVFVEADAAVLPFPDGQFDLVVSRFAFHHFADPANAAAEMARVCRPGGRVAVIDLVSAPGADGERQDELEKLRDPSHRRALGEPDLLAALTGAGIAAATIAEREHRAPAEPWLDHAQAPSGDRELVLQALRAEAEGGAASGLRASFADDGQLTIAQRWLIVAGMRG